VAGWVLTTITGGMAGLAASAGVVVVVVVSVAAASSWLFLSPDDCFAESSAGPDPWTWPGSAACAGAIGFAACGCEAELGLAGFWALAVVPSCAEGLLLLEGGGAVVCRRLALLALRRLRGRRIAAVRCGRGRFRVVIRLEAAALLPWRAACRHRGGRRRWIRLRADLLLGGRGIEQGGKRLGVCLLRRWHRGWPLL
jgi:hypothetical protein